MGSKPHAGRRTRTPRRFEHSVLAPILEPVVALAPVEDSRHSNLGRGEGVDDSIIADPEPEQVLPSAGPPQTLHVASSGRREQRKRDSDTATKLLMQAVIGPFGRSR